MSSHHSHSYDPIVVAPAVVERYVERVEPTYVHSSHNVYREPERVVERIEHVEPHRETYNRVTSGVRDAY